MASFATQVDEWVKKSEARMLAVARESAQRTFSRATQYLSGELVNVQTGFLRASAMASKSEMPKINPAAHPKEGASYNLNGGQITTVLAGLQMAETAYIGWTAAYAGHIHDGTSKMSPRPFVSLAAMQWSATVNQVVSELKSRAGAGQ